MAVQGNAAGISLLDQLVGRTCCGSQGQRGFWVSTKMAGTDRTQGNFQFFCGKGEFSGFCGKVKASEK